MLPNPAFSQGRLRVRINVRPTRSCLRSTPYGTEKCTMVPFFGGNLEVTRRPPEYIWPVRCKVWGRVAKILSSVSVRPTRSRSRSTPYGTEKCTMVPFFGGNLEVTRRPPQYIWPVRCKVWGRVAKILSSVSVRPTRSRLRSTPYGTEKCTMVPFFWRKSEVTRRPPEYIWPVQCKVWGRVAKILSSVRSVRPTRSCSRSTPYGTEKCTMVPFFGGNLGVTRRPPEYIWPVRCKVWGRVAIECECPTNSVMLEVDTIWYRKVHHGVLFGGNQEGAR